MFLSINLFEKKTTSCTNYKNEKPQGFWTHDSIEQSKFPPDKTHEESIQPKCEKKDKTKNDKKIIFASFCEAG